MNADFKIGNGGIQHLSYSSIIKKIRRKAMKKEERKEIIDIVETLKQLDSTGLMIVQVSAQALKARRQLEEEEKKLVS